VEFQRNRERYQFSEVGAEGLPTSAVPPGTGIVHQVNVEPRHRGAHRQGRRRGRGLPRQLVGTDSHTTMINGLGVVGWGVGGIEAEAVMLGQPLFMLTPQVVGVKLTGELPRRHRHRPHAHHHRAAAQEGRGRQVRGVLRPRRWPHRLADRATIANMAPEYGATMGFFPVDALTLEFLRRTGRPARWSSRGRYCKEQGLFRTDATPDPVFTDTVELDIGTVEPALAGPKRPQDRVALSA
jgi:aconitate hydratase